MSLEELFSQQIATTLASDSAFRMSHMTKQFGDAATEAIMNTQQMADIRVALRALRTVAPHAFNAIFDRSSEVAEWVG